MGVGGTSSRLTITTELPSARTDATRLEPTNPVAPVMTVDRPPQKALDGCHTGRESVLAGTRESDGSAARVRAQQGPKAREGKPLPSTRMPAMPRSWYHTIDLPDGSTTPGWIDTRPVAGLVPWPSQLKGGRCLDVGAFDGFWSFEMERRGAAEVIAIDVDDPDNLDFALDYKSAGPEYIRQVGAQRGPGFAEAKAALGSAVERRNRSVYDLDPDADGRFDVVL